MVEIAAGPVLMVVGRALYRLEQLSIKYEDSNARRTVWFIDHFEHLLDCVVVWFHETSFLSGELTVMLSKIL